MKPRPSGSAAVALVLAVGVSTALNVLTFGVLWDALNSPLPGISENATQILTGWGGGMLGVVGAVVGVQLGQRLPKPPEPPASGPGAGATGPEAG